MNYRQSRGWSRLTDAREERCLAWSDPMDELLQLKLTKNIILLQGAHADPCPLSKHQQWAREPQQWTTEMAWSDQSHFLVHHVDG